VFFFAERNSSKLASVNRYSLASSMAKRIATFEKIFSLYSGEESLG
jgi:hypothetical protein